jgi:ATP-dependent DNA helicase RecQ
VALTAEFLLQERFGFSAFRGFQRDVIERTMCGGHSLVIMPTGGGKSLCFQIPACLHRDRWRSVDKNPGPRPLTLVLSPLVALMKDQVDALQAKGIDATTIHSLVSSEQRQQRYRAIAEGQFCIAYVTPERFRKQEFLEAISGRLIPLLAIDEAHCISEWGHDFRPDYSRVGDIRRMLGNPPTIALTATATVDVQRDILHQLHLPAIGSELDRCRIFHAGIHRPNLELHIAEVWDEDAKLSEIQGVLDRWSLGSGIVYFTLIRSLEAMSHRLSQLGIEHLVYHGDLQRQQRHAIQDRFMSGRNPLVLATPAFGMGIDKEDIRFVVHAEIPGSIESYYQEIGRAGRDGRPSECRLLYDQSDLMTQMEFLRWSNPEAAFYERLYEVLEQQNDAVSSFGMEWLRGRLCNPKQSDRRLETALAMLERYDVIASPEDCLRMQVLRPLPIELADPRSRGEKLLRDQRKLYAMVEYAKGPDPRAFLEEYFQPADAS